MFSFAGPIVLGGLVDYGSSRAQWVKGRRVRIQEHKEWLCFREHRLLFRALLRICCGGSGEMGNCSAGSNAKYVNEVEWLEKVALCGRKSVTHWEVMAAEENFVQVSSPSAYATGCGWLLSDGPRSHVLKGRRPKHRRKTSGTVRRVGHYRYREASISFGHCSQYL